MGYTTDFSGHFKLNKPMESLVIYDKLEEWNDGSKDAPLDGYCQWTLTKDRTGIEWDSGEKFYDYVEWLQLIINDLLLPNGYSLSGEVEFQGEEVGDNGFIMIEDNIVKKVKSKDRVIQCPQCGHKFKSKDPEED